MVTTELVFIFREVICCNLFLFQGNRLFKEGKFELAKVKYEKASVVSSLSRDLCSN